jgi:aminoglycoside phosphotransferase (APT) family kinase protein
LHCARPRFLLQRLGSDSVLRCDEEHTSASLVLKSYGLKSLWIESSQRDRDWHQVRRDLMQREFDNIKKVRALGLDQPPLCAVRALAVNPDLGCLLVEEFAPGENLHSAIHDAAQHDKYTELSARLSQVACFLARLHNASATDRRGNDREAVAYLNEVIGQLDIWQMVTPEQGEALRGIGRRWETSGQLRGATEVLIHGDATPTQFLFSDDGMVVVDFERLQYGDRAADIGRIAADLKHFFTVYSGDPWASEPYIQRFYRDYYREARGAGDFGWLTERARFYMGCSELRIARNRWEELAHRQWLVQEAAACLRP